jgi:hypothetical protein
MACATSYLCVIHIFFRHASPQFPEVQKTLNDNHLVAFIIAKRDIEAGEELLWKYDISQGYRLAEPPPTPPPALIKVARKRSRSEAETDKQGQTENAPSERDRVEGCRCTNPCSTIKNCLTPQESLKPRDRTKRRPINP